MMNLPSGPSRTRVGVATATAVTFGLCAAAGFGFVRASSAAAAAQAPAPPPPAQGAPAPDPHADAARALVGQAAPGFTLPDQNDKPHSLVDSKGKWVVLAFYPADMTTGCTFQNISYTRTADKFAPLNAVVYTVSTQDTKSKKEFCAKDSLTHTLLADVGGKTAAQYGVLAGSVAKRYTFYIRPDGTIADVDTHINTRQAGEDSLTRLARLEGDGGSSPHGGAQTLDGKPVTVKDGPGGGFSGAASQVVKMGQPIPDFVVTDVTSGKNQGFTTISAGKQATVIVWVSTKCPVSNAYNDRMEKIASDYAGKNVAFVGMDSNATEPVAEVADFVKAKGWTFPVYEDAGNKVADQFKAEVTPEVFVADSKGTLVYHGPIDDSQDPSGVTKRYLTAALDAVLAGQPAPHADKRAFGCSIKRAAAAQ